MSMVAFPFLSPTPDLKNFSVAFLESSGERVTANCERLQGVAKCRAALQNGFPESRNINEFLSVTFLILLDPANTLDAVTLLSGITLTVRRVGDFDFILASASIGGWSRAVYSGFMDEPRAPDLVELLTNIRDHLRTWGIH